MTFHEIRFPTAVAFHSTGGPERKTEIVTLGSGFEERNAVWANSRRRYDAGYGVKTLDDLHAVIAFFEARNGRLHAFRFKDWSDFKSCAPGANVTPMDQITTRIDATHFQLAKTYTSGPASWTRTIKKPVAGTSRLAVSGSEVTAGFTVDTTTGIVTFTSAPAATPTAGFQFDVPVRFDTDALTINLASFTAGEIPNIPLIEVRV
ncbi:MAG: DUF2460 domain-containing protein [Alphaproteobacteria bacterium]|nr:DUF2460 domain-containing protein [Alphaproteobacteria bacterium]